MSARFKLEGWCEVLRLDNNDAGPLILFFVSLWEGVVAFRRRWWSAAQL